MKRDGSDLGVERRLWLAVNAIAAGAGMLITAVPLVSSLAPSERARALGAPVEGDVANLKPGELRTVEWRLGVLTALSQAQFGA